MRRGGQRFCLADPPEGRAATANGNRQQSARAGEEKKRRLPLKRQPFALAAVLASGNHGPTVGVTVSPLGLRRGKSGAARRRLARLGPRRACSRLGTLLFGLRSF